MPANSVFQTADEAASVVAVFKKTSNRALQPADEAP
jgi:hypothetical protein